MSIASDPLIAGLDDQQREAVLAPAWTGVRAGRCRNRQDPHHHSPDRFAGRERSRRRRAGAGCDIHPARGGRNAQPVARTRRRGTDRFGRRRCAGADLHAAAYRQLRYFWSRVIADTGWQLLDSKFAVVARAASRTRLHASTDDVRDLAGEIEWAKASLIGPEEYVTAVAAARRDPRWTPRKSRLSTPNTRRSRPAATRHLT